MACVHYDSVILYVLNISHKLFKEVKSIFLKTFRTANSGIFFFSRHFCFCILSSWIMQDYELTKRVF